MQRKKIFDSFKHWNVAILSVLMSFCMTAAFAQSGAVKGKVLDELGEPIIGANIVEKGTTNGTITDIDGNYTLSVNDLKKAILQVSFIGYNSVEEAVKGRSAVDVKLGASVVNLGEVVAIGYGTQTRREITGSVANISEENFNKGVNRDASDLLQGKVAGLTITSGSGDVTRSSQIQLRGTSTLQNDQGPMIVIDGVPGGDMSTVSPSDIESISVLKDASATAIYGARGANGVIMVTTKRGNKEGGTKVSYSGSVSLAHRARKMDTMNAQEWCDAFMQGIENENRWGSDKDGNPFNWSTNRADWFTDRRFFDSNGNPLYDTDWQDEATRTAISHNHQLNVQQGGEKSSMGAFLNYTDNQGIMLNTYSKRLNAKIAYDANPTTWLSTAVNLAVNHTWGNSTPEDGGGQDARRTMIEMVPWMPVQYDGKYTSTNTPEGMPMDFEAMSNPVHILKTYKNMNYNTKVFGNAALTFHIIEGLDLKTQFGVDANFKTLHKYMPSDLVNLAYDQHGRAERYHANTLYWQEETYLTYNKTIGEHRINAMAGLSWQERTYRRNKSKTEGFSDDFYEDYNMIVGTTPKSPESDWTRWAMNSYFLRFAYTYKDRYSATVTGRIDGSSKFGDNNKYAFFPSAGLAWNVSQEDFLKDSNLISNLKLHTSYGLTGNSEIDPYKSLGKIKSETLLLNGTRAPYSYMETMPNPDLKWEKTGQFDVGFNLGLFHNRLNFDVSYYNKKTTDLLLDCPVPHSTGFSTIFKNIGSVRNQGLDIMVNGTPVQGEFTWNSTVNLNFNKNEILHLGDTDADVYLYDWVGGGSILRVGESMGSFYGLVRNGIFTEEDYKAGKCEKNQIGRPDRSESREIIGKGLPDWSGSWVNNFSYKNFDLTVDFQFVWGVETLQRFMHSTYDRFGMTNGLSNILYDGYNGTNAGTMEQAIFLAYDKPHGGGDTTTDSQWVANGSYLRLNMLQLGYTFDSSVAKKVGLSGLRLYLSGNNLFQIVSKDFLGYDPESTSEVSSSSGVSSGSQFGQNMTFFSYPRARTFTFGVNVTF